MIPSPQGLAWPGISSCLQEPRPSGARGGLQSALQPLNLRVRDLSNMFRTPCTGLATCTSGLRIVLSRLLDLQFHSALCKQMTLRGSTFSQLMGRAAETFGRVDVVVANAGTGEHVRLLEIDGVVWHSLVVKCKP